MSKGRRVPQIPAYLPRVLRAVEAGLAGRHIEIRHAAGCTFQQGRCTCTPTIHTGAAIDRKYDALLEGDA